jgi:hypothetical protein
MQSQFPICSCSLDLNRYQSDKIEMSEAAGNIRVAVQLPERRSPMTA